MPAYMRTFLNEEEKAKYGRRLSHYLEDHTYKNKITHVDAAKKLGISSNKFSQLKSGGEQGRFITSLDYLKSLANLEGMSLPEFLSYIEGEEAEEPVSRKHYTWEDQIYKALESISIHYRKKFVSVLTSASQDSEERVELLCRLAAAMGQKDMKALRSFVDAMERI